MIEILDVLRRFKAGDSIRAIPKRAYFFDIRKQPFHFISLADDKDYLDECLVIR